MRYAIVCLILLGACADSPTAPPKKPVKPCISFNAKDTLCTIVGIP